MSKGWEKSELFFGEKIKVPADIFIEGEKARSRLVQATYIGETSSGILIDCDFPPSWGSEEPKSWHYRRFINWGSIYCGKIKLYMSDGTPIRAKMSAQGGLIDATISCDTF